MLTLHSDKIKRWRFDHLPDIMDFIRDVRPTWRQANSMSNAATPSWDLGLGYNGAVRLARTGWPEGIEKVSALVDTIPMRPLPTRTYDVAGSMPDVPRCIGGDPFNMIRRGHGHRQRPTMTLVVNGSASASVSAQAIANYGAAMVACIDRLESRGVRVELICAYVTSYGYGKPRQAWSWTVKRANDALDLHAIAFGMAHPAMMRRIAFALMERSDPRCDQPGYGQPDTMQPDDFIGLPDDALYIEGIGRTSTGFSTSVEKALELAMAQINMAAGDKIAELEIDT